MVFGCKYSILARDLNNRIIVVLFNLWDKTATMSHSHSHEGGASHSHDGFSAQEHGHSHEILDGPGSYIGREMPIVEGRDWSDRAFTIGIGG